MYSRLHSLKTHLATAHKSSLQVHKVCCGCKAIIPLHWKRHALACAAYLAISFPPESLFSPAFLCRIEGCENVFATTAQRSQHERAHNERPAREQLPRAPTFRQRKNTQARVQALAHASDAAANTARQSDESFSSQDKAFPPPVTEATPTRQRPRALEQQPPSGDAPAHQEEDEDVNTSSPGPSPLEPSLAGRMRPELEEMRGAILEAAKSPSTNANWEVLETLIDQELIIVQGFVLKNFPAQFRPDAGTNRTLNRAAARAKISAIYKSNPKRAMRILADAEGPRCQLSPDAMSQHFSLPSFTDLEPPAQFPEAAERGQHCHRKLSHTAAIGRKSSRGFKAAPTPPRDDRIQYEH